MRKNLRSEEGVALVLTLVVLVLITALVTEFSYGVYTSTSALHNWQESQRLSPVAQSGIVLAAKTVQDVLNRTSYTYPGRVDIPVEKVISGFEGILLISVEDENGKFNLNSLINPLRQVDPYAYGFFRRLLKNLALDETIADRVADWIDADREPRIGDSEDQAKNALLDTVEELRTIKGIDSRVYDALKPHVTVYGYPLRPSVVNINTASVPVIMSLDEGISRAVAENVVTFRELQPLQEPTQIAQIAGFQGYLANVVRGRVEVKSSTFRITATAEENRIRRTIECVASFGGSGAGTVRYWKEQ